MKTLINLWALLIAIGRLVSAAGAVNSVDFKFVNLAGRPIELFWIDPNGHELIPQSKKPQRNNTDINIHSYNTHSFSVRLWKHIQGSEANFTKGPEEEVIRVFFDEKQQKLRLEQATKATDAADMMMKAGNKCQQETDDKSFQNCLTKMITQEAMKIAEMQAVMMDYRDSSAQVMRNYTCNDHTLKTTEALRSYEYYHLENLFKVNVLLDQTASKIWTVDNFSSEEECNILENHARPNLMQATVSGIGGKSEVSPSRKAQQAAYDFPRDSDEIRDDQLWPLYDRIVSLVNYHSHLNIIPEGQEGLTIIQYNPDDQYLPHCDGSCNGEPYRSKGRVATAVLYCKTADIGGATTFSKSDIFIRPTPGMAVFFSYKSPLTNTMDDGYTEHSGCPIVAGEKWIATAWLREGVYADDTHEGYDPEGKKVIDEPIGTEEQEEEEAVVDVHGEEL